MQIERKYFYCVADILDQLKPYHTRKEMFDVITLVGEGEPTLYSRLGELIEAIKIIFNKPIVLITNGSLFYREDVRKEAMKADIVMPSLDVWDNESFKTINRPYGTLSFEEMFEGLRSFREGYKGEFYLESMCIAGITDKGDSGEKLMQRINTLHPDKVFVNTPVRPPAEAWVGRCSSDFLEEFRKSFKSHADVEVPDRKIFSDERDFYVSILDIIKRHPLDGRSIGKYCQDRDEDFDSIIKKLNEDKTVEHMEYEGKHFYRFKTFRG